MKRLLLSLASLGFLLPLAGQPTKPVRPSGTPTLSPSYNPNAGSFQNAADQPGQNDIGGGMTRLDAQATYANSITERDLEAHVTFLASDYLQGRETGEPGQKIAADYIAAHFQRLGLKPPVKNGVKHSYFQSYPLLKTTLNSVSFSLSPKVTYQAGKDFVFLDKTGMVEAVDLPLVFAGYGIQEKSYDNLQGVDVSGKAVVVLNGEPMAGNKSKITGTEETSIWTNDWDKKAEFLQSKGAKAVIVLLKSNSYGLLSGNPWVQKNLTGSSLQLKKEDSKASIPVIYVSQAVADFIMKTGKTTLDDQIKALNANAKSSSLDFKKLRFKTVPQGKVEESTAENVLGFLEGTDKKDEVVVITAHYDHLGIRNGEVYNGADDDGSGTAAVLELAEAFVQAYNDGVKPRRSILFMPVSGEEKGLLGSEWYSEHPVFPLNKTVCDLNIDMIGRRDEHHAASDYVYVIGSDKLSSQLHEANEAANAKYTKLNLDYKYNAPDDPNEFYYRSDHYNFARHNIPVIFYFSGVHDDYHKPGDDVEKIIFPKMTTIARLVFLTAWDAANRDARYVVDRQNDFEEK